jgi:hypothetical protein
LICDNCKWGGIVICSHPDPKLWALRIEELQKTECAFWQLGPPRFIYDPTKSYCSKCNTMVDEATMVSQGKGKFICIDCHNGRIKNVPT